MHDSDMNGILVVALKRVCYKEVIGIDSCFDYKIGIINHFRQEQSLFTAGNHINRLPSLLG